MELLWHLALDSLCHFSTPFYNSLLFLGWQVEVSHLNNFTFISVTEVEGK